MGRLVEIFQNRFDGGMVEDKRSGWVRSGNRFITNRYSLTKHFDATAYSHKLEPHYKTTPTEGAGVKAYDIVKTIYAPYLSAGAYRLYGLGIVDGTTKPKVYINAFDFTTWAWSAPTKGESAIAGRDEEVFFYYKNYIYMWTGGSTSGVLVRFDTTNSDAFNDTYYVVNYNNVAEPVHHPADDVAYFFHDNFVSKLDDTSFGAKALTLPAQYKIVSACAYGNYLAIACTEIPPANAIRRANINSVVFLWDRDSSLATLTERIDFGEGSISHLANLNNKLIAVMGYNIDNGGAAGLSKGKIIAKQSSGKFAIPLGELNTDTPISSDDGLPKTRSLKDGKLYFPTKATLNGDIRFGIWSVDEFGRFSLDFIEEEATSYQGVYPTGNMWWICHSNDGSINRTSDILEYSETLASEFETLMFDGGDASIIKELKGVTATFEKLPGAGVIALYYRIDEATAWTKIFEADVVNAIKHSAINIESSGAKFGEFKEIEFLIKSYAGAVLTGFYAQAEEIDKRLW